MEDGTVIYSKEGAIAQVVLNRPGVVNAFNMRMRDELYGALEAVRDDRDVRVAVLSGAGERGFCAGADLNEFGTAPSQAVARQVRWERDLWGLFLAIDKPLVASLHGHVLGSGVEIACLCDIRIASEGAVFGMPEVALGMVPAAGGTQTLPRIIGPGRALEMLLTNRWIAAREARRIGLVHRVVPLKALRNETERVVRELVSRRPQVLSSVKIAVREGMALPLDRGLDLERRLTAKLDAPF